MIKFENVGFEVWGNVALNNASFEAKKNKATVVYYRPGSGATSAAKLVCGLARPTAGKVLVGGNEPTPKNINASLFLSEPVFYKNKSAAKNLLVAAKHVGQKVDRSEVVNALDYFGILAKQKPKKMNKVQKLLLSFARSKLLKKNLLVFDDVFKNFDDTEIEQILPVLLDFIKGKTALIFDSTGKIQLQNSEQYYLLFGAFFKFCKKAPIWQIYCMQNKKEKHVGKIVKQKNGFVVVEGCKEFVVENNELLEKAFERRVEEVLFTASVNVAESVFDAMDFERIL